VSTFFFFFFFFFHARVFDAALASVSFRAVVRAVPLDFGGSPIAPSGADSATSFSSPLSSFVALFHAGPNLLISDT